MNQIVDISNITTATDEQVAHAGCALTQLIVLHEACGNSAKVCEYLELKKIVNRELAKRTDFES